MTGTPSEEMRQGDVLWTEQVPMPGGNADEVPAKADVVVIGGGYTGLTASFELARSGREVVLLEQAEFGAGASGRNGGFVHAGVRRTLPELRKRFGDELGAELYGETVAAVEYLVELTEQEGIECDFQQRGYLYLAEKPRRARRLRTAQATLTEAGHTSELLTREAVAEHSGTTRYAGGLLLDGAASIHPARFLAGLVAAASRAGVRLVPGTRVDRLANEPGGGVKLTTSRGPIHADHALVATNGYTKDLTPRLKRRILAIDSFLVATDPLGAEMEQRVSPKGHMCMETKNFLCYWRTTGDGRLVFGGRASFSPTGVERSSAWLTDRMAERFPSLSGVGIAAAWGGKTGFSFDQLPHIGREGDVSYAVGYCGGGVALAPWFGKRAADWIAGGEQPAFARIPHPVVPLYNGRPWFMPMVGLAFLAQDRFR